MVDELPELILADGARVKAAFDLHIASVSLRPKTNNPTNGYVLAASAVFGAENIRIPIDDGPDVTGNEREIFEFHFEMYKAELVLDNANCVLDHQFEVDRSIDKPVPVSAFTATDNRERSTKFSLDTGSLLEDLTGAKVGLEHQVEGRRDAQPDAWFEVTFLDDKTIQFSAKGKRPVPLQGRLLNEFSAWRIIPNQNGRSGVLARIRTRESWIELTQPRPVGRIGRWSHALFGLLKGKGDQYSFRRKAFDILLAHLVVKGLQVSSETRDATLAADTVIVAPHADNYMKLQSETRSGTFDFNNHPITDFLSSPFGDERKILEKHGVSNDRIEALGLPPAPRGGPDHRAPDSQSFEYLLEFYVDRVMANAKKLNLDIDEVIPRLSEYIVTGEFGDDRYSRDDLLKMGILLTKPACEKILKNASQHSFAIEYFYKNENLLKTLNDNQPDELTFHQFASSVLGSDLVWKYLKQHPGKVAQLVAMYDDNQWRK